MDVSLLLLLLLLLLRSFLTRHMSVKVWRNRRRDYIMWFDNLDQWLFW